MGGYYDSVRIDDDFENSPQVWNFPSTDSGQTFVSDLQHPCVVVLQHPANPFPLNVLMTAQGYLKLRVAGRVLTAARAPSFQSA